ncbi:MAG: autotransporter-associated beta strand repeat-containing protein, partial [Planctomycetia bacterium]|nr:autotransporter-associated beta strand repeat-containing protein [Planctomycetia bacterium]
GAGTVNIHQRSNGVAINLGSTTDTPGGPLALSDAELDQFTAGTINIGDVNSGTITISDAITRTAAINLILTTGGSINFSGSSALLDANGGDVTLNAGSGAITSGGGSKDIRANGVTLTGGASGIGSNINPFTTEATSLTASVNGNGSSYLSEIDTVNVGSLSNHTGSVNLMSGTFRIAPGGGINGFSPVFIDSAAVVQLNGQVLYLNSLSGSGRITNDSTTAGILHVFNQTSSTFSGVLGGAGANDNNFSLTTENIGSGGGTLTLSGANTYSGTTTVNFGGLTLSGGSAIIDTGAVVLANTAGVVLTLSSNETIGSLSGGGTTGGNVALGANTLTTGDATNTTFSGVISGVGGSLVKQGAGTFTLSGDNTYTGSTTIDAGRLTLQGTYGSNAFVIGASSVLELNAATNRDYASATFSGAGTLEKTGAGTAFWGVGAATFNMASGSLIDVQAGTFTGGSSGNEVWTNNLADLNVASGATFNGVEADVRVDAITGLGTITSGYNGSGSVTFGLDNASSTFDGIFAETHGPGSGFVKAGSGTITLNGANTHTSTTTVSAGTLKLGNGAALGTIAVGTTVLSGAVLDLNGQSIGTEAVTLNGTGGGTGALINSSGTAASLSGNITLASASSIGGSGDFTLSGVIADGSSGATDLAKVGSGIVTLSGTNTYTGTTTINAETLVVNGSLTSNVTVASGGTLCGTGTINSANTVTVQSGGTVAPGTGPGILNTGNVAFASGSFFNIEIGGTTAGNASNNHDQLNVTGTVSLGNATLSTAAFSGFVPASGNTYTIFLNDGSDAISGTFNGLAEGATISTNFLGSGRTATISYVGGSGNDVVITVS